MANTQGVEKVRVQIKRKITFANEIIVLGNFFISGR